jgi:hypothetical protein
MEAARRASAVLPDVEDLIGLHGRDSFRCEALRRVADWKDLGGDAAPAYERFGELRVATEHYRRVIKKLEHLSPLRDALHAFAGTTQCVS